MSKAAVPDSTLELGPLPFSWKAVPFIVLIAIAAGAACAFVALQLFLISPTYPDFLVGAISWQAASKFQDLASYPAFLLGFMGCAWTLSQFFTKVSRVGKSEYEQGLISVLIWWLVPSAIGIGSLFSPYPSYSLISFAVGLTGSLLTILFVRLHLNLQELSPSELGLGALAIILIGLFPYAIATAFDRLPIPDYFPRGRVIPCLSVAIMFIGTFCLLYSIRANATLARKYIAGLLFLAQVGMAGFYILIVPDLYIDGTEKLAIEFSGLLWFLVAGLVIGAVLDVWRRYKKFSSRQFTDYFELLSPLAIFGTILLLKNGKTLIPSISVDDYHFGESLLGWWGFWQHQLIPYIELIPPHGIFGDDVGGFFSMMFFDGTAATVAEGERLAGSLTMLAAFLAMRWCTKSIGLSYISILMFGSISRKLFFLLLVPFFCIWFKYPVSQKLRRWLWLWLISVVLLIIATPPQGLIAALASLPALCVYLYRARSIRWMSDGIVLLLVGGIFFFLTPLAGMLHGAIRYVIENGPINQIAYGIPWSWSWGGPAKENLRVVILEVFRMSWVLVPIVASALVLLLVRRREYWSYLAVVVLPILVFTSVMTSYGMGRIDPFAISRPGLLSNFSITILLPILLVPFVTDRGKAVLSIVIAFICAGLGLVSVTGAGLNDVLSKNYIGNLWSGSQHGLNNIGTAIVDATQARNLDRINKFLSKNLQPKETYLDMTGRNAHYMYFDRPPPIEITASYNMAPIEQQRRAVDRLSKKPPRMALLDANNMNFDGGGPALRSHLLYRFVIENYLAEIHSGFVYGFASTSSEDRPAISFAIKDFTDANWLNGIHRSDAALIIDDSKTVLHLRVGDLLTLPNGDSRRISSISVKNNTIWFEGSALDSKTFYPSRLVEGRFDMARRAELSSNLMQQTFAVADLQKVPSAWGQSEKSLSLAMKPMMELEVEKAQLHDLVLMKGLLNPIGDDPYLWLDLTDKKLAGKDVGLLGFDFVCQGAAATRLQVFWWGGEDSGSSADRSLRLTAVNGRVIIPLDAYPNWLEIQHIKGLRIDLDSVNACQYFSISNVNLLQRNLRK